MKRLYWYLPLILVGACRAAPHRGVSEAPAVYDAFLGNEWMAWRRGPLVLVSDTDTLTAAKLGLGELSGDQAPLEQIPNDLSLEVKEAITDLLAKSRQSHPLLASSQLKTKHQLITADSLGRVLARLRTIKDATWEFPDSAVIVTLSPVGFDRSGRVAVVVGQSICGTMCGGGEIRVLRKQVGWWLPAEQLGSWVL